MNIVTNHCRSDIFRSSLFVRVAVGLAHNIRVFSKSSKFQIRRVCVSSAKLSNYQDKFLKNLGLSFAS
jgi:hypothetical protein